MEENKKNIWTKLMEIQKAIKTFAVSEDADKTDSRGKTEYRYTPGWEIIERIREEMDKRDLMLIPNFASEKSEIIEYPVYKDYKGTAMSFKKKEMYVTVVYDYTWMDISTGERTEPIRAVGYGANGTDKSGATAMSMAERYFLLRFFHITTHETTDEQDAHDSGNIPGLPAGSQPVNLSPRDAVKAVPVQGYIPQQGGGAQVQPTPAAPQQGYFPGMQPVGNEQGRFVQNPQQPAFQQPAPQPQAPVPPGGAFDANHPAIQQAASSLATFNKGTNSHQMILNKELGRLAAAGFNVGIKQFVDNLSELGQAIREGRNPVFNQ